MDLVNEHLKSIVYENHTLKVIDQLKLPTVLEYIAINTVEDAFAVIRYATKTLPMHIFVQQQHF